MATAFLIRLNNLSDFSKNSSMPLRYGVKFFKIFDADDSNYLAIEFSNPKQNDEVLLFITEEYNLSGSLINLENHHPYLESQEELFISHIPPVLSRDKLDLFIQNFIENEKIIISKKFCYCSLKSIYEQNRKRLFLFLPSIPFKTGNIIASFSCIDFPILRFSNFPRDVDIQHFIKDSLPDVKILDIMESSPKRQQKVKYANVLFESFDILSRVIETFNFKLVGDKTIYVNRFIEPNMKESIQKNEVRVNFQSPVDAKIFYQEMSKFGDIYRIGPMINDENGFTGYVTFCNKESAEALIQSTQFSTSYSMVYLLVCNFPPDTNCDAVKNFLIDICSVVSNDSSKDIIESVIQYDNKESNLTLPSFIVKIKDEYHDLMDEIIHQLSVNPYEEVQPYGLYWSPHEGENKFDDKEIIPRMFNNDDNMIAIFPINSESVKNIFKRCSEYGTIYFFQSCSHTDPPLLIVRYEYEYQCQNAMDEINNSYLDGNKLTVRTFYLKKSFDEIIAGQSLLPIQSSKEKKAQKNKTDENKQMERKQKEKKEKKEKKRGKKEKKAAFIPCEYPNFGPFYPYMYSMSYGNFDRFQPFHLYYMSQMSPKNHPFYNSPPMPPNVILSKHHPYFNPPPMPPMKVCRPSSPSYRKSPYMPFKLPPRSLSPQRGMIPQFSQNCFFNDNEPPSLDPKRVKMNNKPPIDINIGMDPVFSQSNQLQSDMVNQSPQPNEIRKKHNDNRVIFQPQEEYNNPINDFVAIPDNHNQYKKGGNKADFDIFKGCGNKDNIDICRREINRADVDVCRRDMNKAGVQVCRRGGNRADFEVFKGCCNKGDDDVCRRAGRGGGSGNRADFEVFRRGGRGGFRCCGRGSQVCMQSRRMMAPEQPHIFEDLSVRNQPPPGINYFNGQPRTLDGSPNPLPLNQMSRHPNRQEEQRNQNQRRDTNSNIYFAGPPRTLNDDNPPNQHSNRRNHDQNQNKGKGNHKHHHGHRK